MEMDIILKSEVMVVSDIKIKTKAKMFCDIKPGDKLQLSVPVEYAGSSRGRSYAIDIKVENLSNGQVTYKTFNQITSLLSCFELRKDSQYHDSNKVWVVTNEQMEIEDIASNKESAEKYALELNETAVSNNFTVTEYDISN